LQTLIFLFVFLLAPKHGFLAARRKAAAALRNRPLDATAPADLTAVRADKGETV